MCAGNNWRRSKPNIMPCSPRPRSLACWSARKRARRSWKIGRWPTYVKCADSATTPSRHRLRSYRGLPRPRLAPKSSGSKPRKRMTSSCSHPIWKRLCIWCATRPRCWARRVVWRPYDALVDGFTPGISAADIDTIFKALSRKLPGLINQAIEVQAAHAAHAPGRQIQRRAATLRWRWTCSRHWASPSIGAASMKASIPSPRGCREISGSPPDSIWSILSRDCWARYMKPATPCTTWDCRSSGAISRWAATADWPSRRASPCCSR